MIIGGFSRKSKCYSGDGLWMGCRDFQEKDDCMDVIVSNPQGKGKQHKNNLSYLTDLCRIPDEDDDISPFDDTPRPSPKLPKPEALVLQSGKFDIAELLCVELIRKWLKSGRRLVFIIGSWKGSDQIFDPEGAAALLSGLEQSTEGVIFFGQNPIQFYCVPQMHAKLSARCDFDSVGKKYTVTKAMIGSTNLTSGALTGGNFELDLFFDAAAPEDASPLALISTIINDQIKRFEEKEGVDIVATERVQKVFENWRMQQQVRIAGYRNIGLPSDS